jgi:hypothetical protein
MSTKLKLAMACAALGAIVPLQASAQTTTYLCNVIINYVGVNPDGSVLVSASNGISFDTICSVSASFNNNVYGITTDTCKAMLATLLRAQATGASVQLGFQNNDYCANPPGGFEPLNWLYFGPIILSQ